MIEVPPLDCEHQYPIDAAGIREACRVAGVLGLSVDFYPPMPAWVLPIECKKLEQRVALLVAVAHSEEEPQEESCAIRAHQVPDWIVPCLAGVDVQAVAAFTVPGGRKRPWHTRLGARRSL